MKQEEKDRLRAALPITELITYLGARPGSGDAWHCFRHEDKKPSLVANNQRQVVTCFSPECDLRNKRTGKDGLDIFEIIKVVDNCNFMQAVDRVRGLVSDPAQLLTQKQTPFLSKKKRRVPETSQDLEHIPELTDLQEKHRAFLKKRYGEQWRWLADRYGIKGWHYHVAIPITKDSVAFIPLDKEKDQVFYRGKNRTAQLFPNRPEEHAKASSVLVVEGEKDVLAAELALHAQGKLGEWAVITNTNGAGNVKRDTPLFFNFDPASVKKVVICYDNDPAGERANSAVYENAREFFSSSARISIKRFKNKPTGYDIGDYLKEKQSALAM